MHSSSNSFVLSRDGEFGDGFIDIEKTEKRVVRATVKTYEKSGTYVFLKLFKKGDEDFQFSQKISLTWSEFEKLVGKQNKLKRLTPNSLATSTITADGSPAQGKKKLRLSKTKSTITAVGDDDDENDGDTPDSQ